MDYEKIGHIGCTKWIVVKIEQEDDMFRGKNRVVIVIRSYLGRNISKTTETLKEVAVS